MTFHGLASIDPGAEECAMACWDSAELTSVLWVSARDWGAPKALVCVVEVPQDDGRTGPVGDIIRLARSATRLGARTARVKLIEVEPREWKQSVPKAVCHSRAWPALSDAERDMLGGDATAAAISKACDRGAAARWKPHHNHYYRDRELPYVGGRGGLKITHDILDAAALGLWYLGRLGKGTHESSRLDQAANTLVVNAPAKRSRAKGAKGPGGT